MKLIDSFLFFNELDLLELRLKYLDDVVDILLSPKQELVLMVRKKLFFIMTIKIDLKIFIIKLFTLS